MEQVHLAGASTCSEEPVLPLPRGQVCAVVPASPLPWKWDWNGDTCYVPATAIVLSGGGMTAHSVKVGKEKNAEYIVHACNAYPKLVAALLTAYHKNQWTEAVDLLRELGELK